MQQDGKKITALIYTQLPDGMSVDYNCIYDVIDQVLSTTTEKTDPHRAKKRFLYQYRDAMRDLKVIQDRYHSISSTFLYSEQQVIREPTCRLSLTESNRKELPNVHNLLGRAKRECSKAKHHVAQAISMLQEEQQKLILVAHYVCNADLKWISSVYGHWTYWANDVRDKAMEHLIINTQEAKAADGKEAEAELDRLIFQWKNDEEAFKMYLGQKPALPPLDDRRMLLGMM